MWCHAPPSFLAPVLSSLPSQFSTSSSLGQKSSPHKKKKQRVYQDLYAIRQIKARKDANLSRQAVLREERAKEFGDPIRGTLTPFVQSFDTGVENFDQSQPTLSVDTAKDSPDLTPPSPALPFEQSLLDHGIKHEELARSLEFSRYLTEPQSRSSNPSETEKEAHAHVYEEWQKRDVSATEAIKRIVSLTNASSKHRTKKNTERIIDTFGRHNTDQILKPKGHTGVKDEGSVPLVATPRVGPDTGSSEVQIGILTAKIRILADRYEGESRKDKVNKRNLRLLLHKRQKLLSYMERKERGSERWQRMITFLGLTPGCWKGEIAVQ